MDALVKLAVDEYTAGIVRATTVVAQQYQGALDHIESTQSQIEKREHLQQWTTRWAWVAAGVSFVCVATTVAIQYFGKISGK